MPNGESNYKSQVDKLNSEISVLKQALQKQQFENEAYKQSLQKANSLYSTKPSARDINPILKQIKNKNLSIREKREIMFPEMNPSVPEDIYYQWVGANRLSIKRDRQWYWTMGLILMIIIVIALLLKEGIWIALALAFFFAIYVNSSIPGKETIYRLTKQGIEIGEGENIEIYGWGQILEYSFYYKHNTEVLYVDTIIGVPPRLQILFSQEDRKNIGMIMEANLPYKRPPKKQNWITRLNDGVYIPLEDFKALQEKIDQYYDSKYAEILFELKKDGKIDSSITVEDVRNVESAKTMQILGELEKQNQEELKKIVGI